MKKGVVVIVFILFLFNNNIAQQLNKYGLYVVSDIKTYAQTMAKDSANSFVNIAKAIPTIKLDLKYATKDNFIKEAVYKYAVAYARKPVVAALKKVQEDLKKQGKGILIYDAYRPYSITEYFYKKVKDERYAANPKNGSRHNRGCAVDVTLIDLKTEKELQMPTKFDAFTTKAHVAYTNLPEEVLNNRYLLISTMEKYGFKVYPTEWWHFDYKGWENFDIIDIPFELL